MQRITLMALLVVASPANAARDAARAPIDRGTWELFGTAQLSAGNGTTFSTDSGAGYFLARQHQVGGAVDLVLNGVDQVQLAPFYRFHFDLGGSVVPYLGGQAGLAWVHIDGGGGRNAQADSDDLYFLVQGMAGLKLLGGAPWSLLVQLAVGHYFGRGTDPYLQLFAGFSVYL
jgi:hypothetical protein